MNEIVYLDVCCFKRPFDDATVERIRREAEAVAVIMDAVHAGRLRLVRSPAHELENEQNPREDRRLATRLWLNSATVHVVVTSPTVARGRELSELGFSPLDALHVAFAEASSARWFVTTDDRLLKRAQNNRSRLRVEPVAPDELPIHSGDEP